MALPKYLKRILDLVQVIPEIGQRLERIEAKLDAVLAPVGDAQRGYLWTSDAERVNWNSAPQLPPTEQLEPPKIDPNLLAEQLAYDTYAAREIAERVDSLTAEERVALIEYEKAHKNRPTVIASLTPKEEAATPPAATDAEKQLEADTGHDVVQTGDSPPTYVETDTPAPTKE